MSKTFTGRIIFAGEASGEAIVSRTPMNTLATYKNTIVFGKKKSICGDQNNKDLYKKDLTNGIICLPSTGGSTTAGLALMAVAELDKGPKALLFAEHIDSLAAAGVILSDIWSNKRIITIDQLGSEFLEYVKTGMQISVKSDGSVIVG